MSQQLSVCVFCGSSHGNDPAYRELAASLGRAIGSNGSRLVYGGGSVGLMGVVADAVMDAGGEVVGVIPEGLFRAEVAHQGITELLQVADMHERKRTMYSLADGFVVMPGGLGTLEEFFEVATWNQLGLHASLHAIVLLDTGEYWRPLVEMLDATVAAGFVKQQWRDLISHTTDPTAALSRLA